LRGSFGEAARTYPGRRTASEIIAAAGEIREAGGAASTLVLDVTIWPSVVRHRCADPFDVLVNNAGTTARHPFLDVTEDDYDTIANLNLRAAYFVGPVGGPEMAAAGSAARSFHISSQMGHVGGHNRTSIA